eukprot:5960686-Amphidinium_carterae.1
MDRRVPVGADGPGPQRSSNLEWTLVPRARRSSARCTGWARMPATSLMETLASRARSAGATSPLTRVPGETW